jgi:hypothetical protein
MLRNDNLPALLYDDRRDNLFDGESLQRIQRICGAARATLRNAQTAVGSTDNGFIHGGLPRFGHDGNNATSRRHFSRDGEFRMEGSNEGFDVREFERKQSNEQIQIPGSLSAILAFACPLSHLIKLTCTTQVLVWALEAGTLLHLQCQPEHSKEEPTDVQYKRLAGTQVRPTRGARLAAGLWFLPRSIRQSVPPDVPKIQKSTMSIRSILIDSYFKRNTLDRYRRRP